jgi:hypothetical protein
VSNSVDLPLDMEDPGFKRSGYFLEFNCLSSDFREHGWVRGSRSHGCLHQIGTVREEHRFLKLQSRCQVCCEEEALVFGLHRGGNIVLDRQNENVQVTLLLSGREVDSNACSG